MEELIKLKIFRRKVEIISYYYAIKTDWKEKNSIWIRTKNYSEIIYNLASLIKAYLPGYLKRRSKFREMKNTINNAYIRWHSGLQSKGFKCLRFDFFNVNQFLYSKCTSFVNINPVIYLNRLTRNSFLIFFFFICNWKKNWPNPFRTSY